MINLSIRVRLALAYTAVFGILLVLLSIGLYRTSAARFLQQVDEELGERAAGIRPLFSISHSAVTWLDRRETVDQSTHSSIYILHDRAGAYVDGSPLARIYNLGFSEAARDALATRGVNWETVETRGNQYVRLINVAITGSDGTAYLLRVGTPLERTREDLQLLLTSILTLLPLILLTGGVAGWWLAGRVLAPVSEITALAGRISASHLGERLPLRGTGDELDRLSAQLNRMISGLQDSFEQMSQFLSNVSHELRTPLAALMGRSEMAARHAKTVEEFRTVIAGNMEVHQRLAQTVTDLLSLARAEAGQTVLNHTGENLTELVRDAVESTRPLADARGISLRFESEQEIRAEVDPTHVMRMVINLMSNAIKYNKQNGSIVVAIQALEESALISVQDTGIGIAPQDLLHVFDRFFRADPKVSSNDGGTGLGLGLARWVAIAHGGKIEAESQLGSGSCFRIWLPLKKQEPTAASLHYVSNAAAWNQPPPIEVSSIEFERGEEMLTQVVRASFWVGAICALIALLWRGLVTFGLPERIYYSERAIGYEGFLNGAFLFLLVCCAAQSYLSSRKTGP